MSGGNALITVEKPRANGFAVFDRTLAEHGYKTLRALRIDTIQVNVGKLCNQTCTHCHVDAGPTRTEIMTRETAEAVLAVVRRYPELHTVDITGGAPEMNPHFRRLVTEARRLGREVIDRCNLTIFFEAGYEDLPEFLAAHAVHVIASLPCYQRENVDRQRGRGTFDRSIDALLRLNALGYGRPGSSLQLDLVYNPLGASLPPPQAALEAKYREELSRIFGIEFHRLLTITNMPIRRFAAMLEREQRHEAYMSLLVNHFNPATVPGLMCRSLVSVAWDGRLFDCDFNLMLDLPLGAASRTGALTIWDVERLDVLTGQPIATASHCYGCTAGAGSSCSGALA
jgi:radical SAM/Cys-rich protein